MPTSRLQSYLRVETVNLGSDLRRHEAGLNNVTAKDTGRSPCQEKEAKLQRF